MLLVVTQEENELARHRAEAGDLPEQPLHRFGPATNVRRQELPCLVGQVVQDRPDSKMLIGAPPPMGSLSTIAGILLLGAISRNSGLNWSFWTKLTGMMS